MSEILFIAIDPVILTLVENLQQLVEPRICLESDYNSGVKRIFDTRPAIVFLQHKIGDVTCDKMANQVKMLLDGEAVPLVLLSDESVMAYSVVSTYEACFDLCLPSDELSLQVQQLLRTLPEVAWKEPAAPAPQPPGESSGELPSVSELPDGLPSVSELPGELPGGLPSETTLEISLPSGASDFARPFPWQEDASGGIGAASPGNGTLAALEGNGVPHTEWAGTLGSALDEPQLLNDFLEDRFAMEPLPSTFDEPRQEKTAKKFELLQEVSPRDLHRIEREDPNELFGSMAETRPEPSFPAHRHTGPIAPAGKAAPAAAPRSAPAREQEEGSAPPARQPALPAAARQTESPQADELTDSAAATLGIKKKSNIYRILAAGLLLIICVASLDLFYTRHKSESPQGIGELDRALNAHPPPPLPAAPQLPQFIPQVAPDPEYAAGHPGWERYRADALEYLVYRENGSIRAIQVLSEQRGAITEAFLKTCIRISSGQDQFALKHKEEKSGLEVSSGTLQNGGELLIYRVIPDGEIRGFVVSFPVDGPAPEVKK